LLEFRRLGCVFLCSTTRKDVAVKILWLQRRNILYTWILCYMVCRQHVAQILIQKKTTTFEH